MLNNKDKLPKIGNIINKKIKKSKQWRVKWAFFLSKFKNWLDACEH